MPKLQFRLLTLLFILFASGCTDSPSIEGLDLELWKNDKYGCDYVRFDYLEILVKGKDKLLNRDQNVIEAILGSPDEHQLDKRKQKFFYYYLEPGPKCGEDISHPIRLQIRFNALGLSSEVFFENY